MCLVNFHFQDHPKFKLIVVANRDEFFERPTKPVHYWNDVPSVLAGRDLLHMGTWLGISKEGKFAALTNYRDPRLPEKGCFSRGEIIRNFLTANKEPKNFINDLKTSREKYAGYNIILGNGDCLYHYNNILDELNIVEPGTHSLSNHSLNTPWPKVIKGKTKLKNYIQENKNDVNIETLFSIVSDSSIAKDENLPNTGVGLEMERLLSPMFINFPNYGTRSSTVLLIDKDDNVTFTERTFLEGVFQFDKKYEFNIKS